MITTRARERGPKEYRDKQNGSVKLIQLHMHQGSVLFPIYCLAAYTDIPLLPKVTFTHPSSLTSVYIVPVLHLLPPSIPVWPYGTHPFFLNAQSISILSDPLYSLTDFLLEVSYHLFIPNPIHSLHSNQTSQTLHLKNIHFPSLSTSRTPCLCSVQCTWYNYSLIWPLLGLYPQSSITQNTFQRSPCSIPLIHSVYHIPLTSSIICHLRSQVFKTIHFLQRFAV